jgi:SAM-dependent methyltransferase
VRPVSAPPTTCPACGGELRYWRTVASAEPGLRDERYDLLRCTRCRSAVTTGEAVPALYETGAYKPGTPRLHAVARPALDRFDRRRLALVHALRAPPARLLDVGAGRGRFVLAAARDGYQAAGLEPSARGIEAAAAIGADVTQASIEDAQVDGASVDVITLWHVLEHLEDPGAALSRVRGWLRPGGGLLVGVPNLDSLQARLGGEGWYHLDVPRHRIHFTSAGIQALLGRQGFEVVSVRHVLLEHNPFGMWQSWLSRLTRHPSYVYNLLKRNAPARSPDLAISVAMLPLIPVAALAELGAAAVRQGGTIAVLARRRG